MSTEKQKDTKLRKRSRIPLQRKGILDTIIANKTYENTSQPRNSIDLYLQEISRFPLLSKEQEKEFSKKIQKGDSQAAYLLTVSNLRLVISIAKHHRRHGVPLMDLIQEGNIGLMKAVQKFDWKKGCRFSTYASWWIRQSITRSLEDQTDQSIRFPYHVREKIYKYKKREISLMQEMGREPTGEEIANKIDEDMTHIEKMRKLIETQTVIPMNKKITEEGNREIGDFIADERINLLEDVDNIFTRAAIDNILQQLTPRERKIIEMRFGFDGNGGMTLQKVGEEFGLTRERIRQIQSKVIEKLRENPFPLEQFLSGNSHDNSPTQTFPKKTPFNRDRAQKCVTLHLSL